MRGVVVIGEGEKDEAPILFSRGHLCNRIRIRTLARHHGNWRQLAFCRLDKLYPSQQGLATVEYTNSLFCTESSAAGITQVVILAAGLDTRALRLDWPAGSVVFEIDQAGVPEFKDRVLDGCRADGSARRVVVPADLRENWPAALLTAGFDPARPSAWIAEGLLPYLPAEAEIALWDRVHELSAKSSRIAVDHHSALSKIEMTEWAQSSSKSLGVALTDLMYFDGREDPDDQLRRYGWDVARVEATEFAQAHMRVLRDNVRDHIHRRVLIDATRR